MLFRTFRLHVQPGLTKSGGLGFAALDLGVDDGSRRLVGEVGFDVRPRPGRLEQIVPVDDVAHGVCAFRQLDKRPGEPGLSHATG